jgi:hypothetical protein
MRQDPWVSLPGSARRLLQCMTWPESEPGDSVLELRNPVSYLPGAAVLGMTWSFRAETRLP